VQGDVRFAEVMGLMGATVEWEANAIRITGPQGKLQAIDHDCNDIPDAAMTAAVAALFADGCEGAGRGWRPARCLRAAELKLGLCERRSGQRWAVVRTTVSEQ